MLDLDTTVAQAQSLALAQQNADSNMRQTPSVPFLSPPMLPCSATTYSPTPTASEDDLTISESSAGARKDEQKC